MLAHFCFSFCDLETHSCYIIINLARVDTSRVLKKLHTINVLSPGSVEKITCCFLQDSRIKPTLKMRQMLPADPNVTVAVTVISWWGTESEHVWGT